MRISMISQKKIGWRAWSPALAENSFGCFLPDLTRFTTVQCGGARHCSFAASLSLQPVCHYARCCDIPRVPISRAAHAIARAGLLPHSARDTIFATSSKVNKNRRGRRQCEACRSRYALLRSHCKSSEDADVDPDHRIGVERNAAVSAQRRVRQAGKHFGHGCLQQAVRRRRKRTSPASGAARARACAVAQAVHAGARRIERAVLQVVRRRQAQCVLQLPRPAPENAARQGRDHLRGRRRQSHQDHLQGALSPRLHDGERPEEPQHQERRPRHHLHADVDRSRGRDAGVRAHRRDPFGGVRRFLGQEPAGTHHRRRRGRRAHRRRADARRQGDRAQGRGRRGARPGRLRQHQKRGRLQAHRRQGAMGCQARRVAARSGQRPAGYLRAGMGRRRAPAVHPLHLGLDRQAQGRAALDRRLPAVGDPHDEVDVRLQADRCVLVHGRRRLGHRPHLHLLRAARRRRHRDHVRRRADLPRMPAASGRSSRTTRSRCSTPRRPRSARSSRRAAICRRNTTCQSLRILGTVGEPINPEAWMWYHKTVGQGAAAPSSTPGGRPKPAAT